MNYQLSSDNIYVPPIPVTHRDEEYDQDGFDRLQKMQEKHFWYRGRHRFLLGSLDRHLPSTVNNLSAIDLGGGVGGWVKYLAQTRSEIFTKIALADSSPIALAFAKDVLPLNSERYQIDLMNLQMENEWDVAFLLDVIEHLPDDKRAMQEAKNALKPGGLLFVATPAFQQFWSYNDDLAHHQRRYRRSDFSHLAQQSGLKLLDARYFMFFLSPLYILSRMKPGIHKLSMEKKMKIVLQQNQIPAAPINKVLSAIFEAETPLGHWVNFPWGTSILGVFQKQ
jgi:SAM-dependent methyltransferase